MNTVLKIKQSDNQKVYWTSDTHLNHNRDFVYAARGYKSSLEHTDAVINKINEIVRHSDILMHTGDFCLNTDEAGFESLLSRINCQNIYMTWGNHNNPLWKIYQREVQKWSRWNDDGSQPGAGILNGINGITEVYPLLYRNIVFLGNYVELSVDGQYFVMCHYPVHVWNYIKDGAKMVCGHSHYELPFSQVENVEAKILDIGWDGFSKPLSTKELIEIMNKKAIFESGDHHTNNK